MVKKKEPLIYRVYRFLFLHPDIGRKRVGQEFRDESKALIYSYYYRWREFGRSLQWLYSFFMSKWEPVKSITKADKVKLRRIEKMIGVE